MVLVTYKWIQTNNLRKKKGKQNKNQNKPTNHTGMVSNVVYKLKAA